MAGNQSNHRNHMVRRTVEYERLRKEVLVNEDFCHICGDYVNKALRGQLDGSPEADHVVSVDYCLLRGINPNTRENLRLSHRWCNRQKGKKLLSHQLRKEITLGWFSLQLGALGIVDFGIDFIKVFEDGGMDCD